MEARSGGARDDHLRWEMVGFQCDVRTGAICQSGLVVDKMMLVEEKERRQHKHHRKPAGSLPPLLLITDSKLTQSLLETRFSLKDSALDQRALCSLLRGKYLRYEILLHLGYTCNTALLPLVCTFSILRSY